MGAVGLASFTLERDYGVHPRMVITLPMAAAPQKEAVFRPSPPPPRARPPCRRTTSGSGTGRLAFDPVVIGVSTMRSTGARIGALVRVTVTSPEGGSRTRPFRVVGMLAFPGDFTTGGLGTGVALTTAGYVAAQCPSSPRQAQCLAAAQGRLADEILVRGVSGPAGQQAVDGSGSRSASRPGRLSGACSRSASGWCRPPVVHAGPIAVIAVGVLVTANVLAAIPALSAARSRPGRALRTG